MFDSGLTAEETTQLAIEAEVERALAFAGRASAARGAIHQSQLSSKPSRRPTAKPVLLRASRLRTRKRSDRLPKRGGPLPTEATIGVQELRQIYARASNTRSLPFIAVSHYWRAKGNPDPRGPEHDREGAERSMEEFERNGVTDPVSLWTTHPCTGRRARRKGQDLQSLSEGHQHLVCAPAIPWLIRPTASRATSHSPEHAAGAGQRPSSAGGALRDLRPRAVISVCDGNAMLDAEAEEDEAAAGVRGYHSRGWCSFEYALSQMIKASNKSVRADWPQSST